MSKRYRRFTASRRIVTAWICLLIGWAAAARAIGQETTPEGFSVARPGYRFRFPRDHASHPGYKTEWWYYTGHLTAESVETFGFQLTFFRSGLRPPRKTARGEGSPSRSRWAVNDLYFAHFAVSDVKGKKFIFDERLSRGSLGEAGAETNRYRVWIKDWRAEALEPKTGAAHRLQAIGKGYAIDLTARPTKPPVIHGLDGTSRKGAQKTQTSHYISLTRMEVKGTLRVGQGGKARKLSVSGTAWMDHEFGSNQLGDDQVGWDWFSLHLDNGSEVMLYLIRRADGTNDPFSSGTWISPDGNTVHLDRESFRVEALDKWKSQKSGGTYPIRWRVRIPSRKATFLVEPVFRDQELNTGKSTKVTYWEGAVRVKGEADGRPAAGQGYVEMTGYAGRFKKKI